MNELKVFERILASASMRKSKIPGGQYLAPCSIYEFDGFSIEQSHNGCETVKVIVNGDTIGRISRDTLLDAIKARAEKSLREFV
jgi:hypothetical protein